MRFTNPRGTSWRRRTRPSLGEPYQGGPSLSTPKVKVRWEREYWDVPDADEGIVDRGHYTRQMFPTRGQAEAGMTVVDKTIAFLRGKDAGTMQEYFTYGMSFSSTVEGEDSITGYNFDLIHFTEEEEEQIFDGLTERRRNPRYPRRPRRLPERY